MRCSNFVFVAALILAGIFPGQSVAGGADLSIEPQAANQGQTLTVRVSNVEAGAGAPLITFNGRTYPSFIIEKKEAGGGGSVYRSLVAVPALLKPGTYQVTAAGTTVPVTVRAGNFGVQAISLPKGKDNFISSPGEREAVDAAKQTVSEARLWQGRFMQPCKSRISSRFGVRRAVNGKLLPDYFHSGVDFAAPVGTAVCAANAGRVIIARTGWRLHGNTVAIDHGQGVISFYIHLSKVAVSEGQLVAKGDPVGAVGATGRASGPHLHFSLYVNNDATDPGQWFAKEF